MHFSYTPYIIPLFTTGIALIWVAYYSWSHREVVGASTLALLALTACDWTIGYALELAGADLSTKVLWSKIQYFGITTVPLLWLIFCYNYFNQNRPLLRRVIILLGIVPLITLLLVFTNESHGLIWRQYSIGQTNEFSFLKVIQYGPWSRIYWVYAISLVLIATSFTLRLIRHKQGLYRGQITAMVSAMIAPVAGNLLYILRLSELDLTPFGFAVATVFIAWGIFRFQLINLVPLARDIIIQKMEDGSIVINNQGQIVDINRSAMKMIGLPISQIIGKPAVDVFKPWSYLAEKYRDVLDAVDEISIGEGEALRWFELSLSPLLNDDKAMIGRLLILRGTAAKARRVETTISAEKSKLKIFLCHSKDDKPQVRQLYKRLTADDFDAWLDEEKLMPGQDWDLEIRKAVRESDVVVVCLSSNSVTKAGYVQKEIRFALDVADEQPEGTTFIIPARLEECTAPTRLSKWQWVDLFTDMGYEKLKKALVYQANKANVVYLQNGSPDITEPQMVRIPTGRFLMGSTKEQAQAVLKEMKNDRDWQKWLEREQPQHEIELSEYFIGKYPITNREYQAFVKDAKYTPPPGWDGDQFSVEKGSHPVVNVSWHDAVAYCKWLSEKTGKGYCLPTEAHWEKAARWRPSPTGKGIGGVGESLIYPWGNTFDPNNANTAEATIGGTSDVGKFSPQGDSPYGCADMAGNVWEWTHSPLKPYPYKADDGREDEKASGARVLRGGSWSDDQFNARVSIRGVSRPSYWSVDFGFRVVALPSG